VQLKSLDFTNKNTVRQFIQEAEGKMADLEAEAMQLCKQQRTPSAYCNIIAKSIVTAEC